MLELIGLGDRLVSSFLFNSLAGFESLIKFKPWLQDIKGDFSTFRKTHSKKRIRVEILLDSDLGKFRDALREKLNFIGKLLPA